MVIEVAVGGTTCEARGGFDVSFLTDAAVQRSFDILLGGKSASSCIDVTTGPGDWTIGVTVERGTLRHLTIVLRDSVAPGDACEGGLLQLRRPFLLSYDLIGMPGSWVNACGEEFAEIVEGVSYPSEMTGIDSPLALLAFTRGSIDLVVSLSVTLP